MSATPALPPGYNFFQTLWRMFRHSNNELGMMQESMKQYDGTYSANIGSMRIIVTQDPAFIEHVLKGNQRNYHKSPIVSQQLGRFVGNGLLTSNGDYWLKQRRLIQPGFHHEKIHALFSIIKKTVDDFLAQFPVGKKMDMYPQMNKLTFEIVINSLFNVHIPDEKRNELSIFITEVQDFVLKDVRQPYKSWWFRLSGEENKNLDRSKRAREIISELIHERKQSPDKFNDLLDMLLDARYEDNGQPMSEDQVIDEILIMLIAGHETSANALSFALFLLATHPAELQKLQNETVGLSLEEIVKNEALLTVINETMRLYPPAWISDRVALADDRFQDFNIPKDTTLVLFYYGLHRNPEFFKDPLSFQPDRFLKKNIDKEKQKAFYPFGAGPRMCIGNNFALAEMAIFLQAFISHFDIKSTGQTPALKPLITLRPDKVILDVKRN
ncbi:MAG: cytochrome P450 [Opitutaceae bacterium]|nr:cytochrome P450 [Cytophagales bacterium]